MKILRSIDNFSVSFPGVTLGIILLALTLTICAHDFWLAGELREMRKSYRVLHGQAKVIQDSKGEIMQEGVDLGYAEWVKREKPGYGWRWIKDGNTSTTQSNP